MLIEALGIREKELISLVGAGGKTTLMFRLSQELVHRGKNVLTTTTTKILEPSLNETPFVLIDKDEERIKEFIYKNIDHYHHITIGSERLEFGKINGIYTDLIDDLFNLKNLGYIIVEADGAARKPIKAPREKEPVIPSDSTSVIGILGIDGIGMELNDRNVFQAERISKLTGVSIGEKISEDVLTILFTHQEGIFKGKPLSARAIAFLNKVDIPEGIAKARRVANGIVGKRKFFIEKVILGQLKFNPPVVEVISS